MISRMHNGANPRIFQFARKLRERSTKAENIMWEYLKTKPAGVKFRRQHPYSLFVLDFYCHRLKLVIEVDGSIHSLEEVSSNDKKRQDELEKNGLVVIRFTNELVENNFEKVKEEILNFIANSNNGQKE